jgi:hypothetical protein
MSKYKDQAIQDILDQYASFFIGPYDNPDQLNKAIETGEYTGELYQDKAGKSELLATFRLEPGEGIYCIFEGSIWIVAYYDILNRWYRENKNFIDSEANKLLA